MARLSIVGIVLALPVVAAAQLQVVSTSPALNATAPRSSTVSFTFDRAVDTATVGVATFRVFGQWSGAGTRRATPSRTATRRSRSRRIDAVLGRRGRAREPVARPHGRRHVAAPRRRLRVPVPAPPTAPSAGSFKQIDDVLEPDRRRRRPASTAPQATDLNHDGFLDLATVNEVSADVRVFLNRADGSGLYRVDARAARPIGVESSPNEPGRLRQRRQHRPLRVSASIGQARRGSSSATATARSRRHADDRPSAASRTASRVLDVDGDGDLDIVDANVGRNKLALMINDGNGVFGTPTVLRGRRRTASTASPRPT